MFLWKISRFSKFSKFLGFNRLNLLFDQSKNSVFKAKPLQLTRFLIRFLPIECQDICETYQKHMLCKLANHLTKRTLLVIWQIYDGFSTSRNKSSSLVLKPCNSVQETSEEVMFLKARQIHIHQDLMLMLDSSSIEAVSIKNYEIQIFRSVFMHIQVYLCRVSILTTLDIYKDYFKDRQSLCKVINLMQSHCACKL